jgi:hypothetical protein
MRQYDPAMNIATQTRQGLKVHRIQQAVKWVVYALLVVNYGFYIYEDVNRSFHTLTSQSSFREWTNTFATTIDISAWLLLILMLELETYLLDDRTWKEKRWVPRVVRGTRLVCFAFITHTVFAYTWTVNEYSATQPVAGASSLCDLADAGVSFVYNLQYSEVDSGSCRVLSAESEFFYLGKDPVVTTTAGLELERGLAWADLIEVVTWLVIIAAMEIVVRLQGRGVTGGPVIAAATSAKYLGYAVVFALAVYWASLSHWLYTWDTFVWIAGFTAIEINLSEWRHAQMARAVPA